MGKFIVEKHNGESIWRLYENEYGDIAGEEAYLTLYTEPDLEQVRKEAYEQGLSDAKEGKATCQYCEYQYLDDTEEPCKKCCNAYMNKYKPKAKEEQIQVGDEVIAASGKAVIIDINDNKDKARYIYSDSTLGFDNICNLSKTGRHFPEIAAVLEKMRGEQDG